MIVGNNHIKACTDNHISPTAIRLGSTAQIINKEAVVYNTVQTIHIKPATTRTTTMGIVVHNNQVLECDATKGTNTCTAITVCCVILNISMPYSEAVPQCAGIFNVMPWVFVVTVTVSTPLIGIVIFNSPSRNTDIRLIQYIMTYGRRARHPTVTDNFTRIVICPRHR